MADMPTRSRSTCQRLSLASSTRTKSGNTCTRATFKKPPALKGSIHAEPAPVLPPFNASAVSAPARPNAAVAS
ncbi:hypothetical protein T02_5316 [Trichinella nativa]|uniref:Uncharacterized protein n=2 Tax=Trichinella TaxID=6333 RepID=A0A0V1LMP1_9BILA|nr:hypothetical protein T12_8394 [Trichinella patagoniensis]KRZ60636.1 hypothetical protein T02_5316 [Trichinella nativa]